MESHSLLDASGASPIRQLNRSQIVFTILALLALPLRATAQAQALVGRETESGVKQMYEQGRWSDVVRAVPEPNAASADLQIYRGLALAKLERWEDAREAFETGAARYPQDPRFLIELGGIAYRKSNFKLAKNELRRALRIEPADAYTNNFVGSIYFLDGNLEAALKYWNRASQPKLADLSFDPSARVDPLLVDRAVRFSPDSVLFRDRFLAMDSQIEALGLYSSVAFDLSAKPEGDYDLTIRAPERIGLGSAKLESALTLLRGLPYQTVFPEFYDLGHHGLNWLSMVRWDAQQRRVFSEASAPLESRPDIRYRLYFDGRNENWNLTRTLSPAALSPFAMNMETAAAGAEILFIPSGLWSWNAGVEYSYRDFRNLGTVPAPAAPFFATGSSLALRAAGRRTLIRYPERRFTLESGAKAEFGTFFESPVGRYERLEGSLAGHWFPKARGDDYELQSQLRAGKTFGQVPFDELFMLGFERDNDLWMRGHPDLTNDQKGSAPLGRNFVLENSEIDKIAYRNGLVSLRIGPFLDTGRVYDPSGYFGTRDWLWDTGAQMKIQILGSMEFVLGYGKDLRTGRNSFFTTVSR